MTGESRYELRMAHIPSPKSRMGVKNLMAKTAIEYNLTLVHISSDYVFDGATEVHDEDEAFAPLGVYGQTKAAGDIAVAIAPKHYILRSSWVIGDGHNFVKTMIALSDRVANPDGRWSR